MQKISLEKKVKILFALAVIIILAVSVLAFYNKLELIETNDTVSRSYKIDNEILIVLNQIQAAELSRHKYLTNGNANDLVSYKNTLDSIKQKLVVIGSLFKDSTSKLNRLDSLQVLVSRHIKRNNLESNSLSSRKLNENEDISVLDSIRKTAGDMSSIEEAKLKQKINAYQSTTSRTLITFAVLVMLFIIAFILLFGLTLSDIKERKKVEDKLHANQMRLKTIIDTVPALIFLKDKESKYLLVNKTFTDLFETTESEVIGKKPLDIFLRKDGEIIEKEDSLITSGEKKSLSIEEKFTTRKGEFWFKVNRVPLYNDHGQIIGLVGVASDITTIKEAEETLRNSESKLKELNEAKDKFFSLISHDLKSPFLGLLGYSDYLLEDYDKLSEKERKGILSQIHDSSKMVFNLVENLLDWSLINGGQFKARTKRIELNKEVENVLSLLKQNAEKKKIRLINNLNGNLHVMADERMVHSLIQNLISNAIKFTPNGGSVEVTGSMKTNETVISVRDTGIGMSKEEIDKLFRLDTKYTNPGTANESGTGLGLLLCKELVEKMGGTIEVKSQKGEGTDFEITMKTAKLKPNGEAE